jgi:hypothetical protein
MLNSQICPVFRYEVFCSLRIGQQFRFDDLLGCYTIDLTKGSGPGQNKTGSMGALVKLPRSENAVFDQWLKVLFFSLFFGQSTVHSSDGMVSRSIAHTCRIRATCFCR